MVNVMERPGDVKRAAMRALGEQIAEEAAHMDAAMHRVLAHIREFDAGSGWGHAGAQSCAHWLSWRLGWSLGTGREHVRVARRLGELPRVDEALRQGKLSYAKVRAITRVASAATEELLLADALLSTGAQLETICRKFRAVQRLSNAAAREVDEERKVTRRDLDDGMVRISATLRPEEAALVMAAIEQLARASAAASRAIEPAEATASAEATETTDPTATAQATKTADRTETPTAPPTATAQATGTADPTATAQAFETAPPTVTTQATETALVGGTAQEDRPAQVSAETRRRRFDRADALVAMAQAVLRGEKTECAPFEVVVTVQRSALTAPAAANLADELENVAVFADGTCVPAETARRLTCDCGVVGMVEDEHGSPLSAGRRTRTLSAALKRALLHRDGCCRFPGCTNRVYLEGHHIEHWAHGGETSLENTCLLCTRHHVFVHEYGYRLELVDGDVHVFDPHGRRVHQEGPRIAPSSVAAWQRITDENAALGITPATNAPRWSGLPVQYDLVVGSLARRAGLTDPPSWSMPPPPVREPLPS
jgi:hypothetical protein